MKPFTFLFCLMLLGSLMSCKKSENTPSPSASNDFKFVSLVAADTVLTVNGITTITANATGQGLSYKWTSEYGTFVGSGSMVQWTVCHSDKFKITCEISDNANHSESRDVYIRTQE